MIHYKGYMAMYHYSKRVDYQSIARNAMLNNDTMILFEENIYVCEKELLI